ncbi:MAG: HipA domain-containing protein [Bacteroidetes bacterium]|nr:HipA domain-containing protein [Bacteroidota bacterium]
MNELTHCPSTLAAGFDTYSPVALKKLFDKRKVSHILPYQSMESNESDAELFMNNRKRISLSGVQSKYSMILHNDILRLTNENEQGQYILKPKPSGIKNPAECAANENLTMQIAEQVFGIETAANGLCFFKTGEPAYLTKRFDRMSNGDKCRIEDFASLAGLTSDNGGANFKYDRYSYEDIAELIKRYIPAWRVELLKFYRIVVFNFLFSNGDAHLKNFSIIETKDGDFRLSPAYDLLNTKLHVDDTEFALDKGLFRENHQEFQKAGTRTIGATFWAFGLKIGLPEKTIEKELMIFTQKNVLIEELTNNSFLSGTLKKTYFQQYQTRRNRLADMKL